MRLRSDGGSASSTGFIRKPKMGRAKTSAGRAEDEHRDDHPEQARPQLAEVLGEAHP